MFDFSPNGFDPTAFFVRLGIIWAGYVLFLGVSIYLGRRLGDWRIPALAAVGLILPEVGHDVIGPFRGSLVESRELWALVSTALTVGQWLLYAAVVMRTARLVRERAIARATA